MTTLPRILIAAKGIMRLSPIGGRAGRGLTSGVSHEPTLRLSTGLREWLPIPCGPALRALRGAVFDARFQKRVGLPQLSFADPLARKYMMGDDGEFAKRVSRDGLQRLQRDGGTVVPQVTLRTACRRGMNLSPATTQRMRGLPRGSSNVNRDWLHLPRPDLI